MSTNGPPADLVVPPGLTAPGMRGDAAPDSVLAQLRRDVKRRREARKVAESWFGGDDGAPIEFELCCSMFGISADQMRKKIGQMGRRLSAPWN